MRISVVIPTFNCGGYLRDAIRSVLRQSHAVHELIVVDDGSTDDTPAVVGEFRDVIYIRIENQGAAAARNRGIARACGDWIAFLDADDFWHDQKIEVQARAARARANCVAVCSEFDLVDAAGVLLQKRYLKVKYRIFAAYGIDWPTMLPERVLLPSADGPVACYQGAAFQSLLLGNFVSTSSILLRRDALERSGVFTEGRVTQEDYDLWLRLSKAGSFAYVDHPLLVFRRRPNQLTSDDQRVRIARDVRDVVMLHARTARDEVDARTLSRRMSDVHRSLALAYLGTGRSADAREALWEGVRAAGLTAELALAWLASWLPASVVRSVRTVRRRTIAN